MAMDNITSNNNANFYWWFGVVEDRNDPLRLGRCRVRIIGYHTEDNEILPSEDLPWAMPIMPANSAGTSGLGWSPTGAVEGTWVVGFFADGENGQHPMFFGTVGAIPGGLRAGDCAPSSGPGSPSDGATTDGYDTGGDFAPPTGNSKNIEEYLEKFLDANGSKLANYGPLCKAAIMAQCYHETGGFKYFTEFGNDAYFTKMYDIQGDRPSTARRYGNTSPGDGKKYRGRGFIQITWKDNYNRAGQYIREDLVNKPETAATKEVAAKLVLWYFNTQRAYIGKQNKWGDIVAVTKAINGGTNGLNDRKAAFARYKKKYGVA